jgi:signal recognition particle subunit SRP54
MFEALAEKLELTFKKLKGQGKISASNIQEALREVRLALLEADVNFKVVKPRRRDYKGARAGSPSKPHA